MALALIAGTGALPPHIATAMLSRGDVPVICEMRGFASEIDTTLPRLAFRLETFGTFLATLQEAGVDQVCMAGAMSRPAIDADQIDARTAPLVPRLMKALSQGDDGTLRAFVAMFEENGMSVVGAHEIAPDLLPPEGVPTHIHPFDLQVETLLARDRLAEMGRADLGQAVVIRGGQVLAQEDARGTDAMLKDLQIPLRTGSDDSLWGAVDAIGELLGDAADWLSGEAAERAKLPGAKAVLFKAPKPGQDLRVDMPTIGMQTVMNAAEAGLAGIVIEAGAVLVLNQKGVLEALDGQGMFLQVGF